MEYQAFLFPDSGKVYSEDLVMRLRLTMRPLERESRIPINYQYPLSAAIYKILAAASPMYATQLHDGGYVSPTGQLMKLFVFSRMEIARMRHEGRILIAEDFSPCAIYLASPMFDFIENFVAGLFERKELVLGNAYTVARFQVETVEQIPAPDFEGLLDTASELHCLSLSPINIGVQRQGRPSLYLDPDHPGFPEAIRQNLLHKFTTAYGAMPHDGQLTFRWDDEYIERRGGYKRISKLIWIKEGEAGHETKVKGFVAPFYLGGDPELIHCAYECGLGDKNSLGFGMIEYAP